ncbi:hypothetical protein CMUS01_05631 [Colletotrichum musicola]|uniref:RNase H type-1 domain-containing protein n=1 Tax=Colletotrichum musicola TaxID=2175873 RepID=A0A8H6NKE4_9PEZI|nr:hypothetical protein CMUS01_05631 [Colletotrichum musicola]
MAYHQPTPLFSTPAQPEFHYLDRETAPVLQSSSPLSRVTRFSNEEVGRVTRVISTPVAQCPPNRLHGDIAIYERSIAEPWCHGASYRPPNASNIRIFTDASFPNIEGPSTARQPAGCAIIYKAWAPSDYDGTFCQKWFQRVFQLHGSKDFQEAELHALALGLETGLILSYLQPTTTGVQLHTDCKDAIRKLMASEQNYDKDPLVRRTVDASKELWARGIRVSITWSPGHVDIEGNDNADSWAKHARKVSLFPLDHPAEAGEYEIDSRWLLRDLLRRTTKRQPTLRKSPSPGASRTSSSGASDTSSSCTSSTSSCGSSRPASPGSSTSSSSEGESGASTSSSGSTTSADTSSRDSE